MPTEDEARVRRADRGLAGIFLEIASVVFAVLLALGVNEWWSNRDDAKQARRATDAIAREIRENRSELLRTAGPPRAADPLASLDSAVAAYREGREPRDVAVNWPVAFLSSAAWETAQVTGTTRDMPLDRVIDLARLYEFQRYFSRSQDELTSLIAKLGARLESEPVAALVQLRSVLANARGTRKILTTLYACRLVGLEGTGAVEEGACPREEGADPVPEDSVAASSPTPRAP